MSEETTSSASTSETAQPESVAPPSGAPKRKLWIIIAAIVVVAILIGSSVYVLFLAPMRTSMSPSDITVDAGQTMSLCVVVKKGMNNVTDGSTYRWRLNPDTLASFNLKSKPMVNLTAGKAAGTGTISVEVTYKGETKTLTDTVTIRPPVLDQVVISPSVKTVDKGMSAIFTAAAIDSVADPIEGLTYTWAISGSVGATLNQTSGVSVNVTAGDAYGNVTVSATATYSGVTKTGSAILQIAELPQRTVDYLYYDLFNVPFGEWWDQRWIKYHIEEPITDSYPYLFNWHGQPEGNVYIYSNMRLNITGRNMTDLNMNERPEFLPMHGTATGGNAVIDWYMQYLTSDEMSRYPDATSAWNDGWVVALNGTVTLDKQAAMTVLKGMTSTAFDTWSTWWPLHQSDVTSDITSWIIAEAGYDPARPDMDIYPMYDANYQMLTGAITGAKVGDKVVLTYDLVTWGIECLITRWMHEAFMPTEWYMEDMNFHATIGPEMTTLNVDTAVVYAMYAYEVTNTPATGPEPCWVWEALNQDYVGSSPPEHPYSGFDQYAPFQYLNTAPGSDWYGKEMPYDYEPYAYNLSAGETMKLVWPQGDQMFKVHVPWNESASGKNETGNRTDTMWIPYSEPMESDNAQLAPGSVTIDNTDNFIEFKGPIDMWDWSKDQNAANHQWLKSEWNRMGILPYGAPYIEIWPEHAYTPTINHFVITDIEEMPLVDTATSLTVTAYDELGLKFKDFTGEVNFTSDRTDVDLPGNYTFTYSDQGVHTFDNLTFRGIGDYTITVSSVTIPQAQGNASVWAIPESQMISGFEVVVVGVKGNVVEGLPSDVRLAALNQFPAPHNIYKEYTGTAVFATNASAGTYLLPPNASFALADEGRIVVHGLQFNVSGEYNVTVSDQDTGVNSTVNVSVVAGKIDYRIYDMFEEPWHDWWEWRLTGYRTDMVLNDVPHEYTMVYNPDARNLQGIIYAPYRWNMTATTVPTLSVHDPEFMPILGTPDVAGASADIHIWMQYFDNATWYGYWVPTWKSDPNWLPSFDALMPASGTGGQYADGYYQGAVYTVSLNREGALEWMGMPLTGSPVDWWNSGNNDTYMQAWRDWILYEGNVRLDIWPAYEWPYIDVGTMMNLTEEPNGNVTLRIAHIDWGFEALITRWLNETRLCIHEPYMEDFNLSAHYAEAFADVSMDAVGQYNLHAVKANGSASNDAAWVWEPQRMDYVEYYGATRNSEFNPWANAYYTSWNSGDGYFGDPLGVNYDATPQWFNLTSSMTLDIQLPTSSSVIGYAGEGLTTGTTFGAIYQLRRFGDTTAYDGITVHGPMTLGYNMTGLGPGAVNMWDYYDQIANKIHLVGPMNFDNYRHPNGLLYHSAPYIEFNVANVTWGPIRTASVTPEEPVSSSAMSVDAIALEVAILAAVMSASIMVIATKSVDVSRRVKD